MNILKTKFIDKGFRSLAIGLLMTLTLFFLAILTSMSWYVKPETFLKTLLSNEVLFSVRLSIVTANVSTALALGIAIPLAYVLSRVDFPGKSLVDALLDIPMVMPPISLGAALLIFFSTPLGGIIQTHFVKFVFEPAGLILAQFTVVVAVCIRVLKAAFDGIDPRYELAARTLGCTKTEAFFKVTLPLAKKSVLAAAIVSWARAIGEFGASVTLAGATRMRTETMPIAIFLSLASADVEMAVAIVFILLGIAISVLIFLRKIIGSASIWR
ncbi:ABC transporter permease [Candidatus Bathyarchaeota archaeon]|nr:ABC transporter permease [Candidatus Bathyarchaeota archaeon]